MWYFKERVSPTSQFAHFNFDSATEIAPMFWGTLSDTLGRRPIAAACLLLLSLSCVGLALVPTSAYWLLMVLRCLQAAGSASTLAIGMFELPSFI
jgi:MFS family permease